MVTSYNLITCRIKLIPSLFGVGNSAQ